MIVHSAFLQGGLLNYAKIVFILSPFILMWIRKCESRWPVWALAFSCWGDVVIPVYGLNKFPPMYILLGSIFILQILDRTISGERHRRALDGVDRMVLIMGLIIIARFIYDRPGFVFLGADKGGFTVSLAYIMGSLFYFTIRRVVATAVFERRQLPFIAISAVVCNIVLLLQREADSQLFWVRTLVNEPAWLLGAALLSLLITMPSSQRSMIKFYLFSFGLLALGLISTYRSRSLFFLSEILMVSALVRKLKKTVLVLVVGGVVILPVMIAISGGHLPGVASRALSIFVKVDVSSIDKKYDQGALGWEDNFRFQLVQLGWERIKKHPVTGNGFALDVADAVFFYQTLGTQGRLIELHALGGAYHNSALALAVQAGVPAAVLFLIITFAIPVRLFRGLAGTQDQDLKVWGMMLLAAWCANTAMMLMNGGPTQFFNSMLLNGYMAALWRFHLNKPTPVNSAGVVGRPEISRCRSTDFRCTARG
jgi:hypothetical protein